MTASENLDAAIFGRLPRIAVFVLTLLLILFVALRYAEPIGDGDLFWHMEYARQMLDRGTLVVSSLPYSWTPTSNAMNYCAWISELILYGLWRTTGLAGIFALRYAIVAFVLGLVWLFARGRKISTTPLGLGLIAMLVGLIYSGTLPKAEMFSLACFTSVVFVYCRFRAADLAIRTTALQLYIIPAIVLLWVNSHGAFILVSPLLTAIGIGEFGLFAAGAAERLPHSAMLHMLLAWMLCGAAVTLTPYGLAYPVELFNEYALGAVARPDGRWNTAMRSIFDPNVGRELIVWLVGMTVLVTGLIAWAWRRAGTALLRWLPLGLASLPYIPLYVAYLRSTHFLPIMVAFFALAMGGLLAERTPRRAGSSVTASKLAGAAFAGALSIYGTCDAYFRPSEVGWVGFGISTLNPVAEAEFLARQNLGPDIYNVFDSGGYLIWRLYPRYLVETDSRSFPYLSWFEDQYAFTSGTLFEPFLQKYPADVAVIDLAKQDMWRNFVKTRDWRLVYYGPTAAIFVRAPKLAEVSREPADDDPLRFADLESEAAAVHVFEFSTFMGDYKVAKVALQRLTRDLRWRTPQTELDKAIAYRDAMRAIAARDFPLAFENLQKGLWSRPVSDRDRLVLTLLVSLVRSPEKLDDNARSQVVEALRRIVPAGF